MSRRDLVRQAQELGWTLERRTKHGWRFRRGDQTASLPGTPSDRRSLTNFKADIRRRRP